MSSVIFLVGIIHNITRLLTYQPILLFIIVLMKIINVDTNHVINI